MHQSILEMKQELSVKLIYVFNWIERMDIMKSMKLILNTTIYFNCHKPAWMVDEEAKGAVWLQYVKSLDPSPEWRRWSAGPTCKKGMSDCFLTTHSNCSVMSICFNTRLMWQMQLFCCIFDTGECLWTWLSRLVAANFMIIYLCLFFWLKPWSSIQFLLILYHCLWCCLSSQLPINSNQHSSHPSIFLLSNNC